MSDSGEGRWTVLAAVDEGVPADVLTTALYERFSSRGEGDFANRILSAMRKEFGGHDEIDPGRRIDNTINQTPAWHALAEHFAQVGNDPSAGPVRRRSQPGRRR